MSSHLRLCINPSGRLVMAPVPPLVALLDDDQTTVDLLADFLGHHGFPTVPFLTKDKCLSTLHLHHPDVIITDINSPVMDGLTFLRTIKSFQLYRHIPVIILSGYAKDSAVLAESLGALACFSKPCRLENLLAAVAYGCGE